MSKYEVPKDKSIKISHILYEIEMYYYSYKRLSGIDSLQPQNPLERNVVYEDHMIHLRNMIEFFNCAKDTITVKHVLKVDYDFSFEDKFNVKRAINKSIGHITKERFTEPGKVIDGCLDGINELYSTINQRVDEFMELLKHEDNLNPDYREGYDTKTVQNLINNIDMLRECSAIVIATGAK